MQLSYQELGQGITCIEAYYQRPKLACCYLVREGDEAAIIDTGTAYTVPHIMELLAHYGLSRDQVKYVIPTHVHLDHAGGAGQLMEQLPSAQLVIHPNGARHMINPEKLIAGTIGVYGEAQFKQDYGEILPIPEERVLQADDGLSISLGGRQLVCIDTPGHARHHFTLWDEQSKGLFTGDTFGIAYPELNTERGHFALLPSTPIDFDPERWQETLKRLMSYQPERVYLTHYCMAEQPADLAKALLELIDIYVETALNSDPDNRYQSIKERLKQHYLERLDAHGCTLEIEQIDALLNMDLGLCAQGLDVWLKRREKR
ncbi:MAG: MBL fold metallo-hydrolase [Sedimenticola sp.]